MARALHDPVRGYYARNIRSIGARGDFTTAPQRSEAPAKAIATWLVRSLHETKTRHVIEIGPGLGTLTAQVIRSLPFAVRLRSRFHLVESSPRLAEHQKALFGKRVSHHSSILEAMQSCSGEAVIFSNELVDAFPARIFRKTLGAWQNYRPRPSFPSITNTAKQWRFMMPTGYGWNHGFHTGSAARYSPSTTGIQRSIFTTSVPKVHCALTSCINAFMAPPSSKTPGFRTSPPM